MPYTMYGDIRYTYLPARKRRMLGIIAFGIASIGIFSVFIRRSYAELFPVICVALQREQVLGPILSCP